MSWDTSSPAPGIPPSRSTTVELIGQMKRDGVKLILVELTSTSKLPTPSPATPARNRRLMPSVGGEKEITDYFKLFDYDICQTEAGVRYHE